MKFSPLAVAGLCMVLSGCAGVSSRPTAAEKEMTQTKVEEMALFNTPTLDPIRGKLRFPGSEPVLYGNALARNPTQQEYTAILELIAKYDEITNAYIQAVETYQARDLEQRIQNAMNTKSLLTLLSRNELSMNVYNDYKGRMDSRLSMAQVRIKQQEREDRLANARVALQAIGLGLQAAGTAMQYEQMRRDAIRENLIAIQPRHYRCERSGNTLECRQF